MSDHAYDMHMYTSQVECRHYYISALFLCCWAESSSPPLLLEPVEHFSSVVSHLLMVGPSLFGEG